MNESLVKELTIVLEIVPRGFIKKKISFGQKMYSKIKCRGCCERQDKTQAKVETNPKTRLQGMFSLFYDVFWS